jgi:hypothetical protein
MYHYYKKVKAENPQSGFGVGTDVLRTRYAENGARRNRRRSWCVSLSTIVLRFVVHATIFSTPFSSPILLAASYDVIYLTRRGFKMRFMTWRAISIRL